MKDIIELNLSSWFQLDGVVRYCDGLPTWHIHLFRTSPAFASFCRTTAPCFNSTALRFSQSRAHLEIHKPSTTILWTENIFLKNFLWNSFHGTLRGFKQASRKKFSLKRSYGLNWKLWLMTEKHFEVSTELYKYFKKISLNIFLVWRSTRNLFFVAFWSFQFLTVSEAKTFLISNETISSQQIKTCEKVWNNSNNSAKKAMQKLSRLGKRQTVNWKVNLKFFVVEGSRRV